MGFHSGPVASFSDMSRQVRAGGLVKPDVRHHSAPEECGHAQARAIEELIRDKKIQRRQIIAKRAHGADRENSFNPEHFHGADVCAIVNLARCETVATSMPGQESHPAAFQCADDDRVRRIAKRSLHSKLTCIGEPLHAIESASAYNSNANRFLRVSTLFLFRRSRHSICL